MPVHEPTYPFSAHDGATAAAVVRDVGSHRRRRPGMSHRPCGAANLLCLEAALSRWWVCRLGALCQSCSQNDPPDARSGRTAGYRSAPAASHVGQAAHRRRTRQSQPLAASGQSRHRSTHPPRRRSLAHPSDSGEKRGFTTVTRTAEEPGQTVNVDLCFVPATRTTTEVKLPAVSGSSGRLVVERVRDETAEPSYPGRAFDDPQRSYTEAMQSFVAAASVSAPPAGTPGLSTADADPDRHAQQRLLGQEAVALRAERRALRQQRQSQLCTAGRLSVLAQPADQLGWRVRRIQRRLVLARRRREDRAWRAQRQRLREHLAQRPPVSAWIAILVITDNCSRQCIELPLFVAGAKVTAAMVVAALRTLLPPDLQFLISDRGTHFTAQVFAQFAQEQEFIHVLIARHRPQSNGIAERFVRTLKAWLADKTWQSAAELEGLLQQFRAEYNDRPHQGVGIPGLSPNEFANRIWLM